MRVKLTELYNTRYFYIPFRKDLVYLFSTFLELQSNPSHPYNPGNELLGKVYEAAKVGTDVEFDLADAKITPDVLMTIKNYAEKGIFFIDTENYCRDSILRENRERMKIDLSEFITLPPYNGDTLVKDYVVSLDKNVKYMMPNIDPEVYIPLAYIIMVTRPSIVLNLGGQCSAFFNFIGRRLTVSDLENYTEFFYTSPEGTIIIDFSNGDVFLQRIGLSDIQQTLTTGTLVPTVLGKEKLLNVECWKTIFKNCLSMLTGYRATRKQSLSELLEVEE